MADARLVLHYPKVRHGNELVGLKSIYCISLVTSCLGIEAKNTIKWNSPFLLKDQR